MKRLLLTALLVPMLTLTGVVSCQRKSDLTPTESDTLNAAIVAAVQRLATKSHFEQLTFTPETMDLMARYATWTFDCESLSPRLVMKTVIGPSGPRAVRDMEVSISTRGHCSCQFTGEPKTTIDFISGGFGITDSKPIAVEGTQVTVNGKRYVFSGSMWKQATQVSK